MQHSKHGVAAAFAVALAAVLLTPATQGGDPHHAGGDDGTFAKYHTAESLDSKNLSTIIGALPPDNPVLMEFFANWCPACRHFAADYDKIAIFFKHNKLDGKTVYVGRVDCATEAICNKFLVESYPNVQFGTAAQFASIDTAKIRSYPSGRHRTPEYIVSWIGDELGKPLKYSEEPASEQAAKEQQQQQQQQHAQAAVAAAPPFSIDSVWSEADVEGATRQLWQIITTTSGLLKGPGARQALQDVLKPLALAHPVGRCRSGATTLLRRFGSLWPEDSSTAPEELREYAICGAQPASGGWQGKWVTCAGTLPTSRGYSCGLWQLFHTIALRLPEDSAAQTMMTALLSFNKHFFLCEPCQKHFGQMLTAPDVAEVKDRGGLALWLWKAHNEVNARLHVIEAKYGHSTTGDPAYPKLQWPTRDMCPACHLPASTPDDPQWLLSEVAVFLAQAYGVKESHHAKHHGGGIAADETTEAAIGTSHFSAIAALAVCATLVAVYWLFRWFLRHGGGGGRGGFGGRRGAGGGGFGGYGGRGSGGGAGLGAT